MTRFLHELSACADAASIEEWDDFASLSWADRASKLQELRDPLLPSSGRYDHVFSICGFSLDGDKAHLVYFWHESLHQHRASSIEKSVEVKECISFFAKLSAKVGETLCFDEATAGTDCADTIASLRKLYGEKLDLTWYVRGGRYFAALVRTSASNVGVVANRARSTSSTESYAPISVLACHLDFYLHRSPLSLVAPLTYIMRLVGDSTELARSILVNPRYFTPWVNLDHFAFVWPWQKCLVISNHDDVVTHRSIPTCSLVFDLRRSYLAMELLRHDRATSYAIFIKSSIALAKAAIGLWGGYFDKETGDGIVAHFVDDALFGDISEQSGAEVRAFSAARAIVEGIGDLCHDFQDNLIFEIDQLGASVGIHSGTATWIYTKDRVVAVGDSVVLATRLCADAAPQSIFVSNPVFKSLKSNLSPESYGRFKRRRYHGKEYNDRSMFYGYCHE